MTQIATAFDAIAKSAVQADAVLLDTLRDRIRVFNDAAQAMIEMRLMLDIDMVRTGEAHARAVAALYARGDALMVRNANLIAAIPADRASRDGLKPYVSARDLVRTLQSGRDQVNFLAQEHKRPLRVLLDGEAVGEVGLFDVKVDKGLVTTGSRGAWGIERIVAAGDADGLAFLLDDGTHVEVLPAA